MLKVVELQGRVGLAPEDEDIWAQLSGYKPQALDEVLRASGHTAILLGDRVPSGVVGEGRLTMSGLFALFGVHRQGGMHRIADISGMLFFGPDDTGPQEIAETYSTELKPYIPHEKHRGEEPFAMLARDGLRVHAAVATLHPESLTSAPENNFDVLYVPSSWLALSQGETAAPEYGVRLAAGIVSAGLAHVLADGGQRR